MNQTTNSFAYRCLPLNIANAHGWEILAPCSFMACWRGEDAASSVVIVGQGEHEQRHLPVSLFGHGVLTFHIEGIFRTPPAWNLWVSGSPNFFKDGLCALSGVIETDWSPYTFTMNWRFTRRDHWVRFEKFEPIAFFFPVQRHALGALYPALRPIEDEPALRERFTAWSQSRDQFTQRLGAAAHRAASETWQKFYYKGTDVDGRIHVSDHQTKLRVKSFDTSSVSDRSKCPSELTAVLRVNDLSRGVDENQQLKRYALILDGIEGQRALSPKAAAIHRGHLSQEEFLDGYFALCRPVVLLGEMEGWRLHASLITQLTKQASGEADRGSPSDNGGAGVELLGPLCQQMPFSKFIKDGGLLQQPELWVSKEENTRRLRYEEENRLVVQLLGRSRVTLLPPSESPKLYEIEKQLSAIHDLNDVSLDITKFPALEGARAYEVELEHGEALYLPFGWWYQVLAREQVIILSCPHFIWQNASANAYPRG